MRLHNGLDDRETHAGAAPRGSTAEALEDIGQFLVRDTRPVVTHLDDETVLVWVRGELDPSAFFGVATAVLDQAVESDLATLTIGHHDPPERPTLPAALPRRPPHSPPTPHTLP